MDYADAVAAFFVPRQEGTELPVAVTGGSPNSPISRNSSTETVAVEGLNSLMAIASS